MFPSYKQWESWSLPTQLSVVSAYITIFGAILSFLFVLNPGNREESPESVADPSENLEPQEGKGNHFNSPRSSTGKIAELEAVLDKNAPSVSEERIMEIIEHRMPRVGYLIPDRQKESIYNHMNNGDLQKAYEEFNSALFNFEKNIPCAGYTIGDTDGDTINDIEECLAGLSPVIRDSDGDGHDDNIEIAYKTDPKNKYSYPNIVIAELIAPADDSPGGSAPSDSQIPGDGQSGAKDHLEERMNTPSQTEVVGVGSVGFYMIVFLISLGRIPRSLLRRLFVQTPKRLNW